MNNIPSSQKQQEVGHVSNAKYTFHLNDNVYIRPKSAKELGISGRIIDIYDVSSTSNSTPNTNTKSVLSEAEGGGDASFPPKKRGKKRRLVEDMRVSIEQHHCFDDNDLASRAIKKGVRPSRLFPVYSVIHHHHHHDNGNNEGSRSPSHANAPSTSNSSITRSTSLIILTPDTTNYRQLATSHLRLSDKVLEIGCSTGECTALLVRRLILLQAEHQRLGLGGDVQSNISSSSSRSKCSKKLEDGQIVAFDTGSDMIERAKKRVLEEVNNDNLRMPDEQSTSALLPQIVQYHQVDALANPSRAYSHAVAMNIDGNNTASANRKHPDVVLIDIGGNRELNGIVRMIRWVQSGLFGEEEEGQDDKHYLPRVIIVKSEALVEELSRRSSAVVSSKGMDLEDGRLKVTTAEGLCSIGGDGIIDHGQEWFSSLLSSSDGDTNDGAQQCNSTKLKQSTATS